MIRSVILLVVGILFVLMALRSLRAQRLKEQYALLYVFVGLPFLVLAVWPDAIMLASRWLAIEKPTVLVLAMGGFLLIIMFKLTSVISVQDRRVNSLTQLLAILMQERDQRTGLASPPEPTENKDARHREDVEVVWYYAANLIKHRSIISLSHCGPCSLLKYDTDTTATEWPVTSEYGKILDLVVVDGPS